MARIEIIGLDGRKLFADSKEVEQIRAWRESRERHITPAASGPSMLLTKHFIPFVLPNYDA